MPGIQKELKETLQKYAELEVEEEPVAALNPLPDAITERDQPAEEAVALNPISDSVPRRSTRNRQEPIGMATSLRSQLQVNVMIPLLQ